MQRPLTGAERQAAHVARGKQVAVVLTDPAAVKALARLVKAHGGVKAAITYALTRATR